MLYRSFFITPEELKEKLKRKVLLLIQQNKRLREDIALLRTLQSVNVSDTMTASSTAASTMPDVVCNFSEAAVTEVAPTTKVSADVE